MAMSAPRSSLFTFESTVHSFHVLRCLDEQRRRDALCDVTVVVEGQSFRAHRSVLASCSEYFTQRTSSLTQHGAVITLPQEVTVDGFQPLLDFAYTSKLHFGKENVLEIRKAATILGFRDLDEACYDFLLPKFLSTSNGSTPFQRKTCCKKKCKSRLPKEDCGTDSDDVLLDEKEVEPVADSPSQQEVAWDCNKSVNDKMGSQSSADTFAPVVEGTNDYFMQCPKYRKFQLACGKETCVTEKSLTNSVAAIRDGCHLSCLPCPSNTDSMNGTEVQFPGNSASSVYKGGVDWSGKTKIHDMARGRGEDEIAMEGTNEREGNLDDKDRENYIMKVEEEMELSNSIGSSGSSQPDTVLSERSAGLMLNHCPLVALNEGPAITRSLQQEKFVVNFKEDQKASDPGVLEPVSIHQSTEGQVEREGERADKTCQTGSRDSLSGNNTRERSMMEMEMTKNLAEQLRPDECSSQLNFQDPQGESSEDTMGGCVQSMSLEWQKLHTDFSTTRTSCPFFQDLNQRKCLWKGVGLSECEGASQSGVSSLNSGEDGDSETETEGDSESYTRERARQVQLPFSVEWIVDLSRNDFQQLLKQQVLTREQLEFVHDMRRRSKNRLAAQRCRKRKLDCIYNLQCEINKLKTEREKLVMEKSQLSQLKLTTCHNVSALCQRVCNEANLQPEQLQVLAKYTSPDCPLSSFFPHIDSLLSQHGLPHGLASEETPSSSSRDTIMGQQSF